MWLRLRDSFNIGERSKRLLHAIGPLACTRPLKTSGTLLSAKFVFVTSLVSKSSPKNVWSEDFLIWKIFWSERFLDLEYQTSFPISFPFLLSAHFLFLCTCSHISVTSNSFVQLLTINVKFLFWRPCHFRFFETFWQHWWFLSSQLCLHFDLIWNWNMLLEQYSSSLRDVLSWAWLAENLCATTRLGKCQICKSLKLKLN